MFCSGDSFQKADRSEGKHGVVGDREKTCKSFSIILALISNIYLTPFDNEMTRLGYRLIKSQPKSNIYAVPKEKSVKRFMDQIRARTKRRIPLTLKDIIEWINPGIRGWETITVKLMSENYSTAWIAG